MKPHRLTQAALSILFLATQVPALASDDTRAIERGKYLAKVSGCNDCHTPGYMPAEGKVPEKLWLTGSSLGFQGPWGTTYPANLRLYMDKMTEAQWLARARQPMRPPMPWFNLKEMSDKDLLALYRYVRSLGPAGEPAPLAAGPGQPVATP
ncbi:MAG TPA: c-type cytochrome, partial [Thiobacillaceae bacterium]|nr:c-type cytochrome [Thiobacillaceae bacterium]